MLYEFRKVSNATTATKNICDVYPEALDVCKCQRWFAKFILGDFDLLSVVEANPCQTIEELLDKLNSPWSTVQEHLKQIGKVNREGVWVPHSLSEENKANRSITCNLLLQRHKAEPLFDRVVTGDEKWVLYDNPKCKRQWLFPKQTPVPTRKPGLHPKKALLCVWWNIQGIIHFEVLEPGQTITSDLYCEQLERVNQALINKHPALVNRKGVILQHDNARPHSAKKTQDKINELGWEVLPHPPYSPDVAPSDYHLFRSLQHFLSGEKFQNVEEVKNGLSNFLIKSHLRSTDLELQICPLDGKRLLIRRVIIVLIKNTKILEKYFVSIYDKNDITLQSP